VGNSAENSAKSSVEQLFQSIAVEVCRDKKVTADEKRLLQSLAKLLGIPVDQANAIANEVINACKADHLPEFSETRKDLLYQQILTALAADDVIDAQESDTLDQIRLLLALPSDSQGGMTDPAEPPTLEHGAPGKPKKPEKPVEGEEHVLVDGKLKPLLCTKCNAVIPLRPATFVVCPYCSEKVAIPKAYIEAVQSRKTFDQRKAEMETLCRTLGEQPGFFGRLLAMFSEVLLAVFIFFFIILSPFPQAMYSLVYGLANEICTHVFMVNFLDMVPIQGRIFLIAFPYFLAFGIPMLFIHYFRRKILTRDKLQTALVAAPPRIPGGPACCRQCGAPLDVPPNVFGVSCPYCCTDNLVGITKATLNAAQSTSRHVGMNLMKAKKEFDRTSWQAFETAISLTLGYVLISGFIAVIHDAMRDQPIWPPSYRSELKNREALLPGQQKGSRPPLNEWSDLQGRSGEAIPLFVPLKKQETIEIHFRPQIAKNTSSPNHDMPKNREEPVRIVFFLQQSLRHQGEPHMLSDQSPPSGDPGLFVAPIGGWYRIDVFMPSSGGISLKPVLH
jgi:hypothetical protein